MEKLKQEIYSYFPNKIQEKLIEITKANPIIIEKLQEIRVRVEKQIILKIGKEEIQVEHKISTSEMLQTLEKLCENSIYAYKNQICQGFLTIKGGHRIGITGTVVTEGEKTENIKYITSLNFRIAKEILGCSKEYIKKIIDLENNTIYNTLIVAPPGKGKTTLLRDCIRVISNGIPELNFLGKTCGLVDERGEIAASYRGIPQNDIGIRTDVISNISKSKGMKMLIRSMAPEIIACDEIGSQDDIQAIKEAMLSGVKGIFTMHGKNMEELERNDNIYRLIENKQIEKIIFLK